MSTLRRVQLIQFDFQPVAVGRPEVRQMYEVRKGYRILSASFKMLTAPAASTDTKICLGDDDNEEGLIPWTPFIDDQAQPLSDGVLAAGDIVDGQGAYLCFSGGKLCTKNTPIYLRYQGVSYGATNPNIEIRIAVTQEIL